MSRLVLVLLLAFSASAWAGMYKWVDDKGVTHYGDSLPPQEVNKATTELNKRGQVVRKTPAAATEAERKALEEQAARRREEEQKEEERKRRDKALLDTYTSESEIDLARDRNLQSEQLLVESTQMRIKSVQGRLDGLRGQVDRITRNKRPVPSDLAEEIKLAEAEIKQLQGNVGKYTQEMGAIRARFEEDKARYRELRGGSGLPH